MSRFNRGYAGRGSGAPRHYPPGQVPYDHNLEDPHRRRYTGGNMADPGSMGPQGINRGAGVQNYRPGPGQESQRPGPGQEPHRPGPGQEPHRPGPGQEPHRPGPGQEPHRPGPVQEPHRPGPGQEPHRPGPGQEPHRPGPGQERRYHLEAHSGISPAGMPVQSPPQGYTGPQYGGHPAQGDPRALDQGNYQRSLGSPPGVAQDGYQYHGTGPYQGQHDGGPQGVQHGQPSRTNPIHDADGYQQHGPGGYSSRDPQYQGEGHHQDGRHPRETPQQTGRPHSNNARSPYQSGAGQQGYSENNNDPNLNRTGYSKRKSDQYVNPAFSVGDEGIHSKRKSDQYVKPAFSVGDEGIPATQQTDSGHPVQLREGLHRRGGPSLRRSDFVPELPSHRKQKYRPSISERKRALGQTIHDVADNYRTKLMNTPTSSLKGLHKLQYERSKGWKNFKTGVRNVYSYFKVWRDSFKLIEGHFGTGILQYFRFLKWLFFLNLWLAIIMTSILVFPQVFLDPKNFEESIRINGSNISVTLDFRLDPDTCTVGEFGVEDVKPPVALMQLSRNVTHANGTAVNRIESTSNATSLQSQTSLLGNIFYYEKSALVCTCNYSKHVKNITKGGANVLIDLLQGTGWMERTVMFYGDYFNKTFLEESVQLLTGAAGLDKIDTTYNMPLAYLLASMLCYFLSLVMMVRQSAQGVKESLIISQDKYFRYCGMVFSGWDFALTNTLTAELKQRQIAREFATEIEEERIALRKARRRGLAKCRLYTVRLLVNILVLALLGASFAAIYYATLYSTEWAKLQLSDIVQLAVQYFPSITITFLNFLIPEIFLKIVLAEDYAPSFENNVTLIRTVFLRLASLAVLVFTIWTQIGSCEKTCSNCINDGIYCWETFVGQQVYKLVILNFLVIFAITFLVEFPRKLLIKKLRGEEGKSKLADIIGLQEFEIPKNVLDLVYTQTLCWLGLFFSPLIPAMTLVQCFLFFYFKKWSLLINCVPSSRAYKASKSNFFFTVVLLVSYILPVALIGYIIAKLEPSHSCGPFRIYSTATFYMYNSITDTISTWPTVLRDIVEFLGTPGFYLPAGILLVVAILYQLAVAAAQKKLMVLLKGQLALEGKDKQFLLTRVNEAMLRRNTSAAT